MNAKHPMDAAPDSFRRSSPSKPIVERTNILATSRLIPEIRQKFEAGLQQEVRAHDEDIRQYLDGRISRLGRPILSIHRKDIIAEIASAVGVM